MQASNLLQQNMRLKQIMSKCQQQIMDLKRIGQDHQNQIDSLLKFNQRLLSIIQNQMPGKMVSRKSSGGRGELLQPIQEMNQGIGLGQTYPIRVGTYQTQSQGGINSKNPIKTNDYMIQFDKMINSSQSDHYGAMPQNLNEINIKNTNGNILPQLNQQQNQRNYGSNNVNQNNNFINQASSSDGFNNTKINQLNPSMKKTIAQPPSLTPSKNKSNSKQQGQGLLKYQNGGNQNQNQFNKNKQHLINNSNGYRLMPYNNGNLNNQISQQRPDIVFREQKQSMIQIPYQLKNFKLQKGLNQQYTKQLFQSIQQSNLMGTSIGRTQKTNNQFGNNTKKGLNLKLIVDEIPTISQAVTQRFYLPSNIDQVQITPDLLKRQINQANKLIQDYKQDYNPEQYLQICMIIKNDLQKDLEQLKIVNKQNQIEIQKIQKKYFSKRYSQKQRKGNGAKKLKQIMNSLGIDSPVKKLIDDRIFNKEKR